MGSSAGEHCDESAASRPWVVPWRVRENRQIGLAGPHKSSPIVHCLGDVEKKAPPAGPPGWGREIVNYHLLGVAPPKYCRPGCPASDIVRLTVRCIVTFSGRTTMTNYRHVESDTVSRNENKCFSAGKLAGDVRLIGLRWSGLRPMAKT
jgi:hypothetical protein